VPSLAGNVVVLCADGTRADVTASGPALDAVAVHAAGPRVVLAIATPLAVQVIDLGTGRAIAIHPPGVGQPSRVVALPGPAGISWGDEGGWIHRWHLGDAAPETWQRHRKAVHHLGLLRLGGTDYLVSGSDDRYVYLTSLGASAVTAACHPHVGWLEGVATLSTPAGRGHALTIDQRRVAIWDFDDTGAIVSMTAADRGQVSSWGAWWSGAVNKPVYAVAGQNGILDLSVGGLPFTGIQLDGPGLALAPGPRGTSVVTADGAGTVTRIVLLPDGRWQREVAQRWPRPIMRLSPAPAFGGHVALDSSGSVLLISQEDASD